MGKFLDVAALISIKSLGFKHGRKGKDMSPILSSHPDPEFADAYTKSYEQGLAVRNADSFDKLGK